MNGLCITFVVLLFSTLTVQSEIDSSNRDDNTNDKNLEQSETMKMLQAIMNDSEFLALNAHKQLRVLIVLYSWLKDNFDNKNLENKKREISSQISEENDFWKKLKTE